MRQKNKRTYYSILHKRIIEIDSKLYRFSVGPKVVVYNRLFLGDCVRKLSEVVKKP